MNLRPFLHHRQRQDLGAFVEAVVLDAKDRPMRVWPHHRTMINFVTETFAMGRPAQILASIGHGKSTCVGLPLAAMLAGQDPTARIKIVTASQSLAEKKIEALLRIVSSPAYQVVFPGARLGDIVNKRSIYFQRGGHATDPTFQACSGGEKILGSRFEALCLLDDLVDGRSDTSEVVREQTIRDADAWLGRGDHDKRVLVLGTPQHEADLYARLQRTRGWRTLRLAINDRITAIEQTIIDGDNPGAPIRLPDLPLWEAKWSRSKLLPEAARERHFARAYQLRAYSDGELYYPNFKDCVVPAVTAADWRRKQLKTFVGVDISGSGRTGCAVVALALEPGSGLRFIVDVEYTSNISALLAAIDGVTVRNQVIQVTVEDNGVQSLIADQLANEASPRWRNLVTRTTTGANKHDVDLGLRALSVPFGNKGILFPGGAIARHGATCACSWCTLKREIEAAPKGATNDGLMALWFCASKAAEWMPMNPQAVALFNGVANRQP